MLALFGDLQLTLSLAVIQKDQADWEALLFLTTAHHLNLHSLTSMFSYFPHSTKGIFTAVTQAGDKQEWKGADGAQSKSWAGAETEERPAIVGVASNYVP